MNPLGPVNGESGSANAQRAGKPPAPAPQSVAVPKPEVGPSATVFFSSAARKVAENKPVPDTLQLARDMEDKMVAAITSATVRNNENIDMALSLIATTAIQTYATVNSTKAE